MNLFSLLFLLFSFLVPLPVFFRFPEFTLFLVSDFTPRDSLLLPVSIIPFLLVIFFRLPYTLGLYLNGLRLILVISSIIFSVFCSVIGHSFVSVLQVLMPISICLILDSLASLKFSIVLKGSILSLFSLVLFALLHLFSLMQSGTSFSFDVNSFPFVFGFQIYQAYTSFPYCIGLTATISIILALYYQSFRGSLSLLMLSLSIFFLFYSFGYARVTIMLSLLLAASIILLSVLFRLISSKRFSRDFLVVLVPISVVLFVFGSLFIPYIDFTFVRFIDRVFVQVGSARFSVWGFYASSIWKSPDLFFFGTVFPNPVAHNLVLDIFLRFGVIASTLYLFLLALVFLIARSFFFSRTSFKSSADNSRYWIPFVLFLSYFICANLFNVALTQPFALLCTIYFSFILLSFSNVAFKSPL